MSITNETATEYASYLTCNARPFGTLRLMLGTQMIIRTDKGIRFDLHGSAHRTSLCDLEYNAGDDLFELRFYRGGKEVKHFDMLFADQLKEVFERYTCLRLSVPRIAGINA